MSKERQIILRFRDKLAKIRELIYNRETMDDRFEKGRAYFDEGEYFEAHEVWEDLWNEAGGARHAFLQCVIQVAVAMHHASNENWKGTRKLLASSLGYLEKGRSDCHPVNLEKLRDLVLEFELALQSKLEGKDTTLPFFKLPVVD